MFNTIFADTTENITVGAGLAALLCAVVIGLVLGVAYMLVSKKDGYQKDFIIGLVLLPAIVSIVILLIGSNVARAFSMAGAFALVRFRSAPGSAKDISVVFFAMASGLACGLGYLVYAGVTAAIIIVVLIVLSFSGFATYKNNNKQLKITIPENLNYSEVFEDVFNKYGIKAELRNVKTTNMGTLYELLYWIEAPATLNEKFFIDELRVRNGNLNISLGVMPDRNNGLLN